MHHARTRHMGQTRFIPIRVAPPLPVAVTAPAPTPSSAPSFWDNASPTEKIVIGASAIGAAVLLALAMRRRGRRSRAA